MITDAEQYRFEGISDAKPITILVYEQAAARIASSVVPPPANILALYLDTIQRLAARKIAHHGLPADRVVTLGLGDL